MRRAVADCEEAVELACRIARRVIETQDMRLRFEIMQKDKTVPRMFNPVSLAEGFSGTALFLFALGSLGFEDFTRAGWAHLRTAFAAANRNHGTSLFAGLSGLLAATRFAARVVETDHTVDRVLSDLHDSCIQLLLRELHQTPKNRRQNLSLLDGLTGAMLPLNVSARTEFVRHHRAATRERSQAAPPDLEGMAHGLTGAISFRISQGAPKAELQRYAELIETAADTTHPAWCNGLAGRILVLVKIHSRLHEQSRLRCAIDQLLEVCSTPVQDAGICHGTSGLVLTANAAFNVTSDARFLTVAERQTARLLRAVREVLETLEHDGRAEACGIGDGLLSGLAGVGLTLASLNGVLDPDWLSLFQLQTSDFA